jgi:hypothetical protein
LQVMGVAFYEEHRINYVLVPDFISEDAPPAMAVSDLPPAPSAIPNAIIAHIVEDLDRPDDGPQPQPQC